MALQSRRGGAASAALPFSGHNPELAIVDLQPGHIPEAARLFAARYRQLHSAVAGLPSTLLDPSVTEPLLERAVAAGPAVVAHRDGELAGYMAGIPVSPLHGSGVGVYVPEWANGAAGVGGAETWEALYAALSARWLERGWLRHCITVPAGDPELEKALAWLGFGACVVDAVLDLARPVTGIAGQAPGRLAGLDVRMATAEDRDALEPLAEMHEAYYASAPTFLYRDDTEAPAAQLRRWMGTPGESVWIAREGARILSFLYVRPPADDVCRAVRDPGTISIGGAFTSPEARGVGIGSAVLSAVETWARSSGFERLSVDFETANTPARRFWLRYFEPVCISFERGLDDPLAAPEMGGRA